MVSIQHVLWVTRHLVWISRASSGWFRALRTCFPGFRARVFRGGDIWLFRRTRTAHVYAVADFRDGAYTSLQAIPSSSRRPSPENGGAHARRHPCRSRSCRSCAAAVLAGPRSSRRSSRRPRSSRRSVSRPRTSRRSSGRSSSPHSSHRLARLLAWLALLARLARLARLAHAAAAHNNDGGDSDVWSMEYATRGLVGVAERAGAACTIDRGRQEM